MSESVRVERVFLLSPANLNGQRGRRAVAPGADFEIARRLRSDAGVPLGELFSFISSLYFRGKLTYAKRFALPPDPTHPLVGAGVHIITPSSGLRSADTHVTLPSIQAFALEDISAGNAAYRRPLEQSAHALAREIGDCEVVLLGSIAAPKYVDVLLGIFGDRLRFPIDFVGRGDMSRGGLLLRSAASGVELPYAAVAGAVRHGTRPPRLDPACRAR